MTPTSTVRFFLGSNTPAGFRSLLPQFTDPTAGWRVTLLKGGPGTGKSTLLRRVLSLAQGMGAPAEEIHCSSDASSLDGVVLPRERLCYLDATPPHAVEPQTPGAVEQPLSLAFWEEDQLYEKREEILALQGEIAAAHRRAVQLLGAAKAFLAEGEALSLPALDRSKITHYAERFAEREFPRLSRTGREEKRLLSAPTNEGLVLFSETLETLCPRLFLVEDPGGTAAPLLLEALRTEALARGLDIISCPCPLDPSGKLDHLILPSLGLGFATLNRFHRVTAPGRKIHAARFLTSDPLTPHRARLRFLGKTAEFLLEEASSEMAGAKALHDRLEALYAGAMDFSAVERITEQELAKLAARLTKST